MKQTEGNFKSVREVDIHYQGWLPEGKTKTVIFIVHGLGEHIGRYMNVVNHFVPLGYAVYGFDNIGHGKSGGAREQVESFDDLIAPLVTYYTMVKSWQPDKPIFIQGHSLGGLIEFYYLLDHQDDFSGAIISAPLIAVGESVTPTVITQAKILSKIAPKMGVMALPTKYISKDPEVVRAYDNDPLVFHGKTPARMGAEMLKAMMRVTTEAGKINLPFIALQGSDDKLVDPGGMTVLREKTISKDKTIKVYEGLYHEVFNEPEREVVLKDVEDWLEAHI
jgi:acylglycerol lipase